MVEPHPPTQANPLQVNAVLREHYLGVSEEVFKADEARAIFMEVSDHADPINKAKYGRFFGTVQNLAVAQLIISIHNIFDATKDGNDRLTILEMIKELAQSKLFDRGALSRYLVTRKLKTYDWLDDDQFSKRINTLLLCTRPTPESRPELRRIVDYRNKIIAHRQRAVSVEQLGTTFRDADWCLDWTKSFLTAINAAYFNISATISDAKRTAICLNRILEDLDVIEPRYPGQVERRRETRVGRLTSSGDAPSAGSA